MCIEKHPNFRSLFTSLKPVFHADFLAVRQETEGTYLVIKCFDVRIGTGDIISEEVFKTILQLSTTPLILSDSYMDVEALKEHIQRRLPL
jgi:hypothetical protein